MHVYRPFPNDPICLHLGEALDRKSAIRPDVRARLTLENRAMARTLEHVALVLEGFASRLEALEADRRCKLSLQANVLMLTQEELRRFALRHTQAQAYIDSRPEATRGLAGRLEAPTPVALAEAIDLERWEALLADRAQFCEMRPDFSERLTGLHYRCRDMTNATLALELRDIVRFALDEPVLDIELAAAA